MTKQGIERFMPNVERYVGKKRIGLVTNPSAVDSRLRSTLNLLVATGRVSALFGLEHGVHGHVQAGERITSSIDEKTGLPVFSLYGENRKPTIDMLSDVDCLVFDLQDVGCRFYTYLYSLLYLLEVAAETGLPLIVLDRPNPLGGQIVGGNILEETFISFVGYPLPIRYGLTIGELALFFNSTRNMGVRLTVVELENWRRSYYWEQTGLSWIPPSPNIPTADTCLVYPGTCLIEGTNLSEGRGTTKPFELIGAPWLDGERLAERLNSPGLAGAIFRATYFTPAFSKYQGQLCGGVQLHVIDRDDFDPIDTVVRLLSIVIAEYGEFEFLSPPGQRYFFDLLAGGKELRKLLMIGDQKGLGQLLLEWNEQANQFSRTYRQLFLY